jgi:hypothetical protein
MDDIEILIKAGKACYGVTWQTQLAHAVDVLPRQMRRYIAGEAQIPPQVWERIADILAARLAVLTTASEAVRTKVQRRPALRGARATR